MDQYHQTTPPTELKSAVMGREKSRKRNAMKATKDSPEWMAAYSARYILEDLNNEEGMESLAELTGLPLGVISAAFKNFFPENSELTSQRLG